MEKWLPQGGGLKTTVVAFLVYVRHFNFHQGLKNFLESLVNKKSPLGKSRPGRVRPGLNPLAATRPSPHALLPSLAHSSVATPTISSRS
jgi:hypothetical protein